MDNWILDIILVGLCYSQKCLNYIWPISLYFLGISIIPKYNVGS